MHAAADGAVALSCSEAGWKRWARSWRNATLAEYADLLAAHTGERRSTPVICRALKQLGPCQLR